ncbi:MAG TPA: protein kinase, partial [Bryobacteraceae bacterium]|nr:protein kinase [Bryobacteraceae bacterium]
MQVSVNKPLLETVPREGLPLRQALPLATELASLLEKAHADQAYGRLRPGNVVVTPAGQMSFVDPEPKVQPSDVAYSSPEEWNNDPIDARSDIFTFGVFFFEFLSGSNPFHKDSLEETRNAITSPDVPNPRHRVPDLPEVLEFIVCRCLRKDPNRRFQNASELKSALAELTEQLQSHDALPLTPDHTKRGYRVLIAIALSALLVVALGGWVFLSSSSRPTNESMSASRILMHEGAMLAPSLSPSGDRVAFSWTGERRSNYDVYVKPVGPGTPQRITTHGDADMSPVWSPDGRYLAFVRNAGSNAAIYVVPSNGGPERKLHDFLRTALETRYRLIAWSPDGQWIAFPASDDPKRGGSLYLLSLTSGEIRRLTTAPVGSAFGDAAPAFSPDGTKLAFIRTFTGNVGDVYLLPLSKYQPSGEPQALTSTGAVTNPVWAPDGKTILFTRFQGTSALWKLVVGSSAKPEPLRNVGELGNFADIHRTKTDSDGTRMVYTRSIFDENIWRVGVQKGSAAGQPEAILASTRRDWEPNLSPDGQRIAFASERSGKAEVWVANTNGGEPRKITSIGSFVAGAKWSPDGKRLAVITDIDGQYEIYLVDVSNGKTTRLTNSPAHETAPSWSRDGRWVYYASNRTGSFRVWRQAPDVNS